MGDYSDELEYYGTVRNNDAKRSVKTQDENDLPALKALEALYSKQIAIYDSVDKLVLGDTVFTIEQQLAVNKEVKARLLEQKMLVDEVIEDIREKYEQ